MSTMTRSPLVLRLVVAALEVEAQARLGEEDVEAEGAAIDVLPVGIVGERAVHRRQPGSTGEGATEGAADQLSQDLLIALLLQVSESDHAVVQVRGAHAAAEDDLVLRDDVGGEGGLEVLRLSPEDREGNRSAEVEANLSGVGDEGASRHLAEELAADGEVDAGDGARYAQVAGVEIGGTLVEREVALQAEIGAELAAVVQAGRPRDCRRSRWAPRSGGSDLRRAPDRGAEGRCAAQPPRPESRAMPTAPSRRPPAGSVPVAVAALSTRAAWSRTPHRRTPWLRRSDGRPATARRCPFQSSPGAPTIPPPVVPPRGRQRRPRRRCRWSASRRAPWPHRCRGRRCTPR